MTVMTGQLSKVLFEYFDSRWGPHTCDICAYHYTQNVSDSILNTLVQVQVAYILYKDFGPMKLIRLSLYQN